jgi:hypothetical protein
MDFSTCEKGCKRGLCKPGAVITCSPLCVDLAYPQTEDSSPSSLTLSLKIPELNIFYSYPTRFPRKIIGT